VEVLRQIMPGILPYFMHMHHLRLACPVLRREPQLQSQKYLRRHEFLGLIHCAGPRSPACAGNPSPPPPPFPQHTLFDRFSTFQPSNDCPFYATTAILHVHTGCSLIINQYDTFHEALVHSMQQQQFSMYIQVALS